MLFLTKNIYIYDNLEVTKKTVHSIPDAYQLKCLLSKQEIGSKNP